MPPGPVIPDTFAVNLTFTGSGIPPVHNRFHVRVASLSAAAVAGEIGSALVEGMWACMSSAYTLTGLEVLKLDGTSSAVSGSVPGSFTGGASGAIVPEWCGLVYMRTGTRGTRGRGRMYIGPVPEGYGDVGVLDSGTRSTMAAAASEFRENVENDLSTDYELVIASYTHETAAAVTSIGVRTFIATQRPRLTRLR